MSLLHEAKSNDGQSIVVLHKGEGRVAVYPNRVRTTFKLTSKDSNGFYGLYEVELLPNAVTPPHVHNIISEMFYVLDGELALLAGEQRVTGKPGSFVSVPKKTVHAFANLTEKPATFLLLFCPEINRDVYFSKVAELLQSGVPNWKELKEELDLRWDSVDPPKPVRWP